ncbi:MULTISPECIES: zinc-binding dehydrogenase [unclassified Achromobacter]|uniref:zinc-binding dehydrogenase n=1 Tax=unclassified Achromobacter TaxID=2626865 RepID=UPI000B518501|nr:MULTISPECIES: zinc-binding dehydrogenase [unclassified Achromobacter]OWT75755.1 quinone oxidoreductase [Achromobacter sp. HZ28]OWT76415.1 quinone oxidoreductase [Achromobacter sp. HZ34]
MKAILSTDQGAVLRDVGLPIPQPNEILVRVRAAGLNRIDLATLAAQNESVLGMEWAGEIVDVGSRVTERKVGERVMCTGPGAFAEYAVTDWGRSMPIPSADVSFEEGATLMLALQTMHDALVTRAQLKRGESVLIHGASSGVGLMAMQIARYLGAAQVIGTSTNAARRARLHEFGADVALDPKDEDWTDQAVAHTHGKGADVIIDQISGPDFQRTMQAAAILGRIVNVGRLGGGQGQVDFNLHALRRITYTGVTFRTRTVEEVRAITAAMQADLGKAVADGTLRLPIDSVFPLEQAAEALERMATNAHLGKIVLKI